MEPNEDGEAHKNCEESPAKKVKKEESGTHSAVVTNSECSQVKSELDQ